MSEELRTDAALLVLLQAGDLVARSGPGSPETRRVEAAATRILDRAEREMRYEILGDSLIFEHANALYYVSSTAGGLWWINPDAGPGQIADWPGRLIGWANQYGEREFPIVLAMQDGTSVIVFEIDPATGRRGRELVIDIATVDPATAGADIGPDGRGLVSGQTVRDDEESITTSWAFDLKTGQLKLLPPEVPEPVILVTDAGGRSLIGEYAGWWEDGFRDFELSTVRFSYSIDELRYIDCLRTGGFGDEAMDMAANMAAMASAADDMVEPLDEDIALTMDVQGARCSASTAHASFSSYMSSSAGPIITTSLWGRNDWLGTGYPTWMTETDGWQTEPSLFSAGPNSTTAVIADTSDVVVLRLTGSAQDNTYDEQRIPFVHNIERAVAVGPNRILAVEGYFWNLAGPRRRVTVLSLKPPASGRMDSFEEQRNLESPAWPDVCPLGLEDDYSSAVRWIARNRVEVSPERQPEHVMTLAAPLADFVRGERTAEAIGLAASQQGLCVSFTPNGSVYLIETATGTAVYDTASGAHLIDLPLLDAHAPIALRKNYREALISEDRRTIERLWLDDDGTWQREPVLFAPYAVDDLFLVPSEEILIVMYQRGFGEVEARTVSMADYRELAFLGSNDQFTTPQLEADGSVVIPELGLRLQPALPEHGLERLEAALSPICKPENRNWQTSPCWPDDLKLGTDQLADESMP
jgi:hypothetical protein